MVPWVLIVFMVDCAGILVCKFLFQSAKVFIFRQCIFAAISLLSPVGKGHDPLFKQN